MASEMASPLEVGREGDHTANKVLFTLHFTEFTGSSGTRSKLISKNQGSLQDSETDHTALATESRVWAEGEADGAVMG